MAKITDSSVTQCGRSGPPPNAPHPPKALPMSPNPTEKNMDLNELADRVEGLSGPDREVDRIIYRDVLGFCLHANTVRSGAQSDTGFDCVDCGADSWGNKGKHGQKLRDAAPAYTASIDAAMTLVPDECLAMVKHLWDGPARAGYAFVSQYTADAEDCDGKRWVTDYQGCAETPALALTAAALRARSKAASQ